jgi:hypothetical protein
MHSTLPFFPDDVRNSMGSPPGGSEFPIHRSDDTLSHITRFDEGVDASIAVLPACAAPQ